jgi:hypothetical protein
MQILAEKLKQAVPDAFEGDGVAYMQSVYRNPSFSLELRLDAAAKAARLPTLAAIAVQQPPRGAPSAREAASSSSSSCDRNRTPKSRLCPLNRSACSTAAPPILA